MRSLDFARDDILNFRGDVKSVGATGVLGNAGMTPEVVVEVDRFIHGDYCKNS